MLKQITLAFATLAMSTVAFAQQDFANQVGYAANLNIGDSQVNISNDGIVGGFYNNNTTGLGAGNICVNVYTFDPSEEEISCCACLVTPNALVSLSAKNDLINNVLTPAIPTSIVIDLVATTPGTAGTAAAPLHTVCDPTILDSMVGGPNSPTQGMLAWGITLEPAATPGTYGPINVPFINSSAISFVEEHDLESVCSFVQQEGTGFGVCNSCALGALSGTKK